MPHTLKSKLDYDDLQHAPDDGKRWELFDGEVYVTPSPNTRHQRVSKRLHRMLEAYFEGGGKGEVFAAPLDVILSKHDVVVPDLVVVTDPTTISDRGVEGPPAIAIEILSPSSVENDRDLKAKRYAALGVEHFWIVDPKAKRLECYRLRDNRYERVLDAEGDEIVRHPDWPELTIPLADLWR
jgi:Uma2 family endonuclease